MRTEVINAEGWTVTVRGRTRRTVALQSEYLITLKQAHPDMRDLTVDAATPSDVTAQRAPKGWSVAGVASTFRLIIARCSEIVTPQGEMLSEPFSGPQLVQIFDHYVDSEELPDQSDLWSKVEAAIKRLDNPEPVTDPNGDGSLRTKQRA